MKIRLLVPIALLAAALAQGAAAQQAQPLPGTPDAGAGAPLDVAPLDVAPLDVAPENAEPDQLTPGDAPLPFGVLPEPEPEPPPVYRLSEGVEPEAVMATLTRLLNQGANRVFFGLPGEANWRAGQGIRIAVYSDQRQEIAAFLQAAAQEFAEATGSPIEVVMTRRLAAVAGADAARESVGANFEILFGSRALMAQFAGSVGMNPTVLTRFQEGRWPFAFVLPRRERWIGRVFVARDEPSEAIEAALVLALVWALGGVTLGDEMQGLIDPFAIAPRLTPLGRSVFSLMYHPDLEAGLAIPETLERAGRLVEESTRQSAEQSVQ